MKYLYLKVFVAVLMLAVAAFSQTTDKVRQAVILNDQGVVEFNRGDFQKAIGLFVGALELLPDSPVFHINLGHTYLALKDLSGSEAAFRKAIALRPANAITHNQLGIVLLEAHRDKEALEEFRTALSLRPNDPVIQLNAGNALIALKDYNGAREVLEKAKAGAPENSSIRVSLGYALAMKKKFGRAIDEIREAIRINPKDQEVQFFLGNLYLANNNRDLAMAQQRKMYDTSPELSRRLFQAITRDQVIVAPPATLGFK